MGRTACTEPQCLYKGALFFFIMFMNVIFLKLNVFQEGNLNFIVRFALLLTSQKVTGSETVSTA